MKLIYNIVMILFLIFISTTYAQDFLSLTLEQKIEWLKDPANFNNPEYPTRLLENLPFKDNEEIYFNYLNKVDVNDINKKVFIRYLNEVEFSKNSEVIANKFLKDANKIEDNLFSIANKFLSGKINGNVDVSFGKVEYLGDWKIKSGNIELDLNNNQYSGADIKSLPKGGFEISPKENLKLKDAVYNLPKASRIIINNDYSTIVPKDTEILPKQGGKIIVEDPTSKIKLNGDINVRDGFVEYFKDDKIIKGRNFDIYFSNGKYSGNYVAVEGNSFTLQGESSISLRNKEGLYNTFYSINDKFGFESKDSINIKPFGPVEKTDIPSLFSNHQVGINGNNPTFKFKYITDGTDFLPKPSYSIGAFGEYLNGYKPNDIRVPGIIIETKDPLMLNDKEFTFNQVKHFLGNEPQMDNYKFIKDDSNKLIGIEMIGTKGTNGGLLDINTKLDFDPSKFEQPNLNLNQDDFGKNDLLKNSNIQEKFIKDAIANNALNIETKFEIKNPNLLRAIDFFGIGDSLLKEDMLNNIKSAGIQGEDSALLNKMINENFGLGKTLKLEGKEVFIDNEKMGTINSDSISKLVIYLLNR
ncbi:hypothetical protein HYX17_00550 [Candidatus Woesearchaeota archaeon]|nr:hypothetical protein [Candidatus Woesearchaeota archaeon]